MIKRPFFVWIIFIFYMFSIASTTLSFIGVYFGLIPLSAERKALLDSASILDALITVATMTCNFAGAIALINLRSRAVLFFVLGLGFSAIGSLIRYIGYGGWGDTHNLVVIFSGIIPLTTCVYVYAIKNRGILN